MPVMPIVPSMPPMPTVSPATIVTRVVVTGAIAWSEPAMAPCVTDVSGLLNVRRLRDRAWNRRGHRRRRHGRERNAAKRGETNKCRNKFHDIHLLTLLGAGQRAAGSAHCQGLMPMNDGRLHRASGPRGGAAGFPICNARASNGAAIATHQCQGDGGFDESDVVVAVSWPVMGLHAHPSPLRRSGANRSRGRDGRGLSGGRSQGRGGPSPTASTGRRKHHGWPSGAGCFRPIIRVFRTKLESGDTDLWYDRV
jgi:hypothetical protein